MSILSPSWFSSEVHKPSFHIIERELEDLFEQRWNCIMNTSHLEWKMHCNPTVILRGKTDESANAGDTEDDTVVGVSVFMVFINDAQSHRCETCDSFVKYMQLRGTDERLDSQPQAQITDMHMHMHMHVRRSPRALWKTVYLFLRNVSPWSVLFCACAAAGGGWSYYLKLLICKFWGQWMMGRVRVQELNVSLCKFPKSEIGKVFVWVVYTFLHVYLCTAAVCPEEYISRLSVKNSRRFSPSLCLCLALSLSASQPATLKCRERWRGLWLSHGLMLSFR